MPPSLQLPFKTADLGQCRAGDAFRFELSAGANVFMVDSSNLSKFKRGADFRHYGGGGLMTHSPHDFVVPRSGHWYIVIHTWGLRNSARFSVTPLPRITPMPPAGPQRATDLEAVVRNAAIYGDEEAPPGTPSTKRYDVFISHASEDKESVAKPLADALDAQGLLVWYDKLELRLGASLRRSIDSGLANSRFGVVILSEYFWLSSSFGGDVAA